MTMAAPVNLYHGGTKDTRCPRCNYGRNKGNPRHSIPEITDSQGLRNAVGELRNALLASGEFKTRSFMLGVLEAKVRGQEYYLAACSNNHIDIGPHLKEITQHKGKWKAANRRTPEVDFGSTPLKWKSGTTGNPEPEWRTIKWEKVDIPLPENTHNEVSRRSVNDLNKSCAAMKLLLELGDLLRQNQAWGPVEYVRMSEQVYAAPEDPEGLRTWHGKGATCSWTAHSCDGCMERIPYLICDVPANWMPN
ncbi:hypothetical protein [Streptomyces tubercidicus]|uniref:Uncharacterized protein n=1 Tax=Streptomyces tubercidicus TaxID=47759 RepID=A0A640UKG5_9ACTN|nr:hypothetical protein [Streptomyces tubercidicus]WAU11076.1 hypothetical protein STRTU_001240 [Streptomyces tubercidicus]GFE36287.1 hypothetical protein Stube_09600 [Streptomyces tubercidicus]